MTTDPVNTLAAQSPGPNPNPMETPRDTGPDVQAREFERLESLDDEVRETPPPQTWKHPDDGKSLSEKDEERPLKP